MANQSFSHPCRRCTFVRREVGIGLRIDDYICSVVSFMPPLCRRRRRRRRHHHHHHQTSSGPCQIVYSFWFDLVQLVCVSVPLPFVRIGTLPTHPVPWLGCPSNSFLSHEPFLFVFDLVRSDWIDTVPIHRVFIVCIVVSRARARARVCVCVCVCVWNSMFSVETWKKVRD